MNKPADKFDLVSPGDVSIVKILTVTADLFHVTSADILGPARGQSISEPRHIVMWLARKLMPAMPLQLIGDAMGRDHSTVINALRSIGRRLLVDSELRERVAWLESALTRAAEAEAT